ncbi:MAG: amidohydrolase family protein [Longimicrobiales bacterium]
MRINGHAHIFNLHTVLTRHAITIMVQRIRDLNVPDFVADAVERFLAEQVVTPEYLVEEELLARFLKHIGDTSTFKNFVNTTNNLPVEIRLMGGGVQALQISALRAALDRISSWFDDGATTKTTVLDVFETLRLAMQADVTGVAATILEDMRAGDGLIALMMDITSEQTQEVDEKKFRTQLKGTADAACAFPGRVFPFVAINTRRAKHYDFLREAVERHGFVGVKLYPSLGVPVDSSPMLKVYDYCLENELPILLHCTLTGFYESQQTQQLGDPSFWWPILEQRPELRVCFAHSGGLAQGVLTSGGPSGTQWPAEIETLMLSYANVYCDLAYHVDQMVSPQNEQFYLKWLRRLLADERLNDRVMFGTDVWLVRLSLADEHYWKWFESKLSPLELASIMEEAPAGFLGLPVGGKPMRKNIARLVEHLREQPGVGTDPVPWLNAVSPQSWTVLRGNPAWTPNNHAHKVTHGFFRGFMTGAQKKLEFSAAGALRLRQFTYFRNASAEDFNAVGQSLVQFCQNSAGTFEGEYRTNSAIGKVAELAADGEKTLADAGATIDAIFRFPTESI